MHGSAGGDEKAIREQVECCAIGGLQGQAKMGLDESMRRVEEQGRQMNADQTGRAEEGEIRLSGFTVRSWRFGRAEHVQTARVRPHEEG
jgi:hypothetical protein